MARKLQYSAVATINPGDITTSHLLDSTIVNADVSASAGIVYSKLDLAGGIVNADVNASAAIVDTKLATIATAGKVSGAALTLLGSVPAGGGAIPNANIAALPALGTSPSPARQTAIVNAEIAAAAAIDGSKLQALSVGVNAGVIPSTGVANAHVAATAAIAYSKLSLTGSIVNADIAAAAAIVDTKLAAISTAGKVDGAALTGFANIPAGAGNIPAANLGNATDLDVFVAPGIGRLIGATVSAITLGPTVLFTNGSDQQWYISCRVPKGATSISSILIFYTAATTGNVYLSLQSSLVQSSGDAVEGTDTGAGAAAYNVAAAGSVVRTFTVASTVYDGLTGVSVNDILSLYIDRQASNVLDTYEANWHVHGVLFRFA